MKRQQQASASARPATRHFGLLRNAFRDHVDLLKRRRADLMQAASIDAYVALDWLSWQGGSLKLTTVGENVYAQLRRETAGWATA